ncbi:MAG: radical SAM protein [Nitrospiraceae bacterium]|nr:MAG: radical SAM protein [Nitrospiraceae bacterium]
MMHVKRLSIELTNHCNLRCHHCADARHQCEGALKMETVEKIIRNAGAYGFEHLSFTGGEPTMHPSFFDIIRQVSEAGYKFSFVSNGYNFTGIYERLLPYRDNLGGITFSLDGADEGTHDRLRGKGSFRRVMQAISICLVKGIPFNFNSVVVSSHRERIENMATLAAKLGSCGLRFGHLTPTPSSIKNNLILSPDERREAEAVISRLRETSPVAVFMAPGNYTDSLFPCAPLEMKEFNIDWKGNVTMCCLLSGHGDASAKCDVIGNLNDITLSEALEILTEINTKFRREKQAAYSRNQFRDPDHFPCWYCLNYFGKVDWIRNFPENPWSGKVWATHCNEREKTHDAIQQQNNTSS